MQRVNEILRLMINGNSIRINERWVWSWGDRDSCDKLFRYIFRQVDRTFDLYHHLRLFW